MTHNIACGSAFSVLGAFVALVLVPSAVAAWGSGGAGQMTARAASVGAGSAPGVSKVGRTVTVSWSASTFTTGSTVTGYVVRRYNALTGAEATIGAACAGVITALTCSESNVQRGSWQYTITPAAAKWRGQESSKSGTVSV